jgi:hypothetical protein
MRAVIIGTDFMKDIDGSFKALETNTNIQLEVPVEDYIDSSSFLSFLSDNNINDLHLIVSPVNLQTLQNISIPDNLKTFTEFDLYTYISSSISSSNYECTLTRVDVDKDAITIPYIEDGDNKLILRLSYDTTALIDDEYARDNFAFLKLMYDADNNSIAKSYINDDEFGFDAIGNTLRDNGNHPNYCVKKRITPSDNKLYPRLYKITTLEQLENIKAELEIDEYIQEIIYNTSELLDNRLSYYRSVDIVYGSDLSAFNLLVFQKSTLLEHTENCDYTDDNIVQDWDRPKYLPKYNNGTNEISVKLDADSNTKILLADDTIKTAAELTQGDIVKSINFESLNNVSESIWGEWSTSYENFINSSSFTTASVNEKTSFSYFGKIVNVELENSASFSDVPHAQVFKSIGMVGNKEVIFTQYDDLQINDYIIITDTETNQLFEQKIVNIFYTLEKLEAYRIDVNNPDLFLTINESSDNKYGIVTHNYDFDCIYWSCSFGFVQGFTCGDSSYFPCYYSSAACLRQGSWYGTANGCYNETCTWQGDNCGCHSLGTTADGLYYCNGNKSDRRLKKNIKFLYENEKGIKIYEFEFIDNAVETNEHLKGVWEGVIAQDLIDTPFEFALLLEEDGYFAVDYAKLEIELKKIK